MSDLFSDLARHRTRAQLEAQGHRYMIKCQLHDCLSLDASPEEDLRACRAFIVGLSDPRSKQVAEVELGFLGLEEEEVS